MTSSSKFRDSLCGPVCCLFVHICAFGVKRSAIRDDHAEVMLQFGDEVNKRFQTASNGGTAVIDRQFKDISLVDYGGKYLVLFFYPLDFSFLCPTEIFDLEERMSEFEAINTSVVAVSTDSRFSHLASVNTPKSKYGFGDTRIPLLSDFNKTISKDYGILVEQAGVALRGTYIIDTNGIVRHMSVNDFSVGRSVDEILRLVQAFQFSDEHGQLCPSSWKPGADSIKPTVEGSKEYFDKIE